MAKKQIEKLNSSHVLEDFNCGVSDLNQFLVKYVLQNQAAAKRWYQQFNFDESPSDSLHLYLLLKDIKKLL